VCCPAETAPSRFKIQVSGFFKSQACQGPVCQTASIKTATLALQVISKDIDHLYMSGDEEERKSIQQTSQMFAAQITQLLFKVPRVLLLLLKTNDCLRSVDLALGEVRAVINLLLLKK